MPAPRLTGQVPAQGLTTQARRPRGRLAFRLSTSTRPPALNRLAARPQPHQRRVWTRSLRIARLAGALACLSAWGLGGAWMFAAQPLDLPPGLSLWDHSITVRTGAGFKDNVLLSHFDEEESPLLTGGVEASLWRLPSDGLEVVFFADASYVRYSSAAHTDDELTAFALAQVKQTFADDWTAGLDMQYFFQNVVLDATDTTGLFGVVEARGHGLTGRPSLRRRLPHGFWLELQPEITRQYFAEPLDDEWQGGAELAVGGHFGERTELRLSVGGLTRLFDQRRRFDDNGFPLAGTHLRFLERRIELRWQQYWDTARRFRTLTRLAYTRNTDNGGGFFDYSRYQLRQELRYRSRHWEARLQARLAFYQYDTQVVSFLDLSKRTKTDLSLLARVERSLSKSLRLFAEFSHERSLSNQAFSEYAANMFSAGFDWGF